MQFRMQILFGVLFWLCFASLRDIQVDLLFCAPNFLCSVYTLSNSSEKMKRICLHVHLHKKAGNKTHNEKMKAPADAQDNCPRATNYKHATQTPPRTPGGATTNGPDATTPPAICQNSGGGGGGGGGSWGGGPAGGRGGVPAGGGGGGCSYRGSGGGGRPARGEGGGGLGLGLGSPSWGNQSWFYNPF